MFPRWKPDYELLECLSVFCHVRIAFVRPFQESLMTSNCLFFVVVGVLNLGLEVSYGEADKLFYISYLVFYILRFCNSTIADNMQ